MRCLPCRALHAGASPVATAKAHRGVVEVITPANRAPLAQDPDERSDLFRFRLDLLQNDRVRSANPPIAIVIAECDRDGLLIGWASALQCFRR